MTISNTAYDTTACSGYKVSDISNKLSLALDSYNLKDQIVELTNFDSSFNLCMITGGSSTEDTIPYFYHPIFIDSNDRKNIVIDVRNFGKWNDPQKNFIVRNEPEFTWSAKRAVLNYIWSFERVEPLRDISSIPLSVYCSLISESVARKFALDPAEQLKISILAGYFYHCLFTNDKEWTEFDFNKMAGSIARATKIPAEKVFEMIDGLPVVNNLSELCDVIKDKTGSIRLNDFNLGVLIAIVSGNWYGSNARENLAVALEHPPTWLMICHASIDERTFKKSVLAKLVDRFNKGGKGDSFIKSMNSLMHTKGDISQWGV